MLLPRLITAIIGIPLILFSIYLGGIPYFVLIFGIVFLSLREYFLLVKQGEYEAQPTIGIIIGLCLFISMYFNGTSSGIFVENQGTVAILSLMLIPCFAREMLRKTASKAIERISVTFFGSFLIPWTIGHLLLIRSLRPSGMLYIYFLFIIIWILDTGAYVVGKKYGKHPLAAVISPKKTIEGAIGGVLTGIISAILFSIAVTKFLTKDFFNIQEAMVVGLIISIIAQFSDLSESLLKRDVGVKDSANLLPGHGGILDRFDSFLFTAPLLYYFLTIIKGN